MKIKLILALLPAIALTAVLAVAPYKTAADSQMNISMVGMMFSPQNITVTQDTTVMWTNQSTLMHTVTADNGMFDSGTINPGGTYFFTFSAPGTYAYYCRFHGAPGGVGMSGTVTVVSSSGQNNPPIINRPPVMNPPINNPPMNMPMPTNNYPAYNPPTANVPPYPQNLPTTYMPPANPVPSYPPLYNKPPQIQISPFRRFFIRIMPHRTFRFQINFGTNPSSQQRSTY